RVLDTRTASPFNAGSTNNVSVTGIEVGGISVPAGAVGVIGTLTVISPTASGYLTVYPTGTAPNTAALNFQTGWSISNEATVRLNGSGQFKLLVKMTSGHTHVLFDVSAFVL